MVREHVRFLLRHAAPEVKRRRILRPLVLGAAAWALAGAALLAGGPGWLSGLLLALGMLAAGSLPGTSGFWVALLGTPLFLLKQRRMPVCDFTIDRAAIVRQAATGSFRHGWNDVTAVRSYSRGYLLVFRRGVVPIPFRCLDIGQLARLRAWAFARPATH
jgi:hypothetical protein